MVSQGNESESVKLLRELVAWTRFQALPSLRETLQREMDDEKKKLVYQYTDGKKGVKEVGTLADVPTTTVHRWWHRWHNIGIVRQAEDRAGRMVRLCSLRDLGIDVPRLREESREQEEPEYASGEEAPEDEPRDP